MLNILLFIIKREEKHAELGYPLEHIANAQIWIHI